jgi:protein CMS1
LSAEHLERIIIDASYIDQKKRGILDMPETQEPLITLLNQEELKKRYGLKEKEIQLIIY